MLACLYLFHSPCATWRAGSVLLMCLSRAIRRVAGVRVEHKVSYAAVAVPSHCCADGMSSALHCCARGLCGALLCKCTAGHQGLFAARRQPPLQSPLGCWLNSDMPLSALPALPVLPTRLQVGDVTAADISIARAAASQAAPGSPALLSTYLPFAQECYAKGRDKEWFRCPVGQVRKAFCPPLCRRQNGSREAAARQREWRGSRGACFLNNSPTHPPPPVCVCHLPTDALHPGGRPQAFAGPQLLHLPAHPGHGSGALCAVTPGHCGLGLLVPHRRGGARGVDQERGGCLVCVCLAWGGGEGGAGPVAVCPTLTRCHLGNGIKREVSGT